MMTSPTSAPRLDRTGARLLVSGDDGSELEGVVVESERDDAGRWELDDQFVLLTDDGERFRVNGWCCGIEEAANE